MINVCIPCFDTLPVEVVASLLSLRITRNDVKITFIQNSLVYDSRNSFINDTIQSGADYLLFVDSDIVFTPDDVNKLLNHNTDIVTGVYYGRKSEQNPIIYDNIKPRTLFRRIPNADFIRNPNPIGLCEGCGMGFCLIKTDALKKIVKRYVSPFEPFKGLGEDLAFCYRARKCGFKIVYDSTLSLQHIGTKKYGRQEYEEWKRR